MIKQLSPEAKNELRKEWYDTPVPKSYLDLIDKVTQKAHQNALSEVDYKLFILIRDVTLKSGSKVGALLAAQTRNLRQELKEGTGVKDSQKVPRYREVS